MNTAKMMRHQRSAIHRMNSTIAIVTVALSAGVLLDGGEFLVRHRHRPGQAQPRLIFGRKIEIGRGLADGVARLLPGLELRIVEHGLDVEKAPQLAGG